MEKKQTRFIFNCLKSHGFCLIPFIFYFLTCAPEIGLYDTAYISMFLEKREYLSQLSATTHQLFMIFADILQYLPHDNPFYKLNLTSVLIGGITVNLFYRLILLNFRSIKTAWVISLFFMFSQAIWWHSTIVDAGGVNALFTVIALYYFTKIQHNFKIKYMYYLFFISGLSIFNHVQMSFLIVSVLWCLCVVAKKNSHNRLNYVSVCLSWLSVGLAPWLTILVVSWYQIDSTLNIPMYYLSLLGFTYLGFQCYVILGYDQDHKVSINCAKILIFLIFPSTFISPIICLGLFSSFHIVKFKCKNYNVGEKVLVFILILSVYATLLGVFNHSPLEYNTRFLHKSLHNAFLGEFGGNMLQISTLKLTISKLISLLFVQMPNLFLVSIPFGVFIFYKTWRWSASTQAIIVHSSLTTTFAMTYDTWDTFSFMLPSFVYLFFMGSFIVHSVIQKIFTPDNCGKAKYTRQIILCIIIILNLYWTQYFYKNYSHMFPQNQKYMTIIYDELDYLINPNKRNFTEIADFIDLIHIKLPSDAVLIGDNSRTLACFCKYQDDNIRKDIQHWNFDTWYSKTRISVDLLSDIVLSSLKKGKKVFVVSNTSPFNKLVLWANKESIPIEKFYLSKDKWIYQFDPKNISIKVVEIDDNN